MFRENAKCQTPTPRLQTIPQRKTTSWNHQRDSTALPSPHSKGDNNAPGIHPGGGDSREEVAGTGCRRECGGGVERGDSKRRRGEAVGG